MTSTSFGHEAGYGFATSVVRKGLIFLYGVVLVRLLGSELYGVWVAFDTVLRPASLIAMMGGSQLLIKELSEARAQEDEARTTNLTAAFVSVVLVIGTILSLTVLFWSDTIANLLGGLKYLSNVFVLYSSLILLAGWSKVAPAALVGFGKTRQMFSFQNIWEPASKLVGLGVLGLIALTFDVLWPFMLIPEAVGIVFLLTATAWLLRHHISISRLRWNRVLREAKTILLRGTPLVGHALASIAFLYSDKAMIAGIIREPEILSVYNVCLTLAVLIMLFHRNLVTVVAPKISDARQRDDDRTISRLYRRSAELSFLLAGTVYILLFLFGREILGLYGTEFQPYTAIVAIVGWAYLFDTFAGCGGYLLIARDRERLLLYNSIGTIALNIGLNWILILHYGIYGAAIATVISYSIKNALIVVENYYTAGYHPVSPAHGWALIAVGLMAGSVWHFEAYLANLGLKLGLSGVILSGCLWVLTRRHRDLLEALLPLIFKGRRSP